MFGSCFVLALIVSCLSCVVWCCVCLLVMCSVVIAFSRTDVRICDMKKIASSFCWLGGAILLYRLVLLFGLFG